MIERCMGDCATDNITPFGRDFCSAQHSTSKLDSAFAYRKKSTVNGQQTTVNIVNFNIYGKKF